MGQYYMPMVQKGNTITGYDITVKIKTTDGRTMTDYQGAKITEHSWWNNYLVNGVAQKIYNRKARLAWVGDYTSQWLDEVKSSDGTVCPVNVKDLYGLDHYNKETEKSEPITVEGYKLKHGRVTYDENKPFTLNNKFFINLSRKEYIDLNAYYDRSVMRDESWEGWCQSPISLMTSTGGDLGGGDYHEGLIDFAFVGRWAYDEVVIRDKAPKGYTLLNVTFNENMKLPVVGVA